MCPVNRGMKRAKTFLPFSLIKKIVAENPQVQSFGLSNWGEPLLHPDFQVIIKYLTCQNKGFYLNTNATLLNENMAKCLVQSNLTSITFSIDGVGKTYEKIRGTNYQKVKQNILHFLSLRNQNNPKITVKIMVTVSMYNEKDGDKIVKEWSPYATVTAQPAITFKLDNRKGKCSQPFLNHLVVLSNGTVTLCCVDYEGTMQVGNAYNQSLNEILGSEQTRFIQQNQSEVCRFCSEYQTDVVVDRFKTEMATA